MRKIVLIASLVAATAGVALAQPCNQGGVRMRYMHLRETGFSYYLSADEPDGRVHSTYSQWSGKVNGQALHGGTSPSAHCDSDCHCHYANRGDGDLISDSWDKAAGLSADPPSSYGPMTYGGGSHLEALSNSLVTAAIGEISTNLWGVNYVGSGLTTDVDNVSGSNITEGQACWGGCGDPYFVDEADGCGLQKEEHMIVLDGAKHDADLHLNLNFNANVGYGHSDFHYWFMYCAPYLCTCVGTPAELSMATKVEILVELRKRSTDSHGNPVPGTLLNQWSASGSIVTKPTDWSYDGVFAQPGNFTLYEQGYYPMYYDFGHGDELIGESWLGKGVANIWMPIDIDIKEPCILVIHYKIKSGTVDCE